MGISQVNDSVRGTGPILARTITSGNTALKPEVADTYTVGAVASPRFIPGFRASIDYYNIDIAGVISTLSAQTIVDRCAGGAADLCKLITRDGTGNITDVAVSNLNLNALKTSGFDIEADYRVPIGKVNIPGDLNTRFLATHVEHLITIDSNGPVDRAGQIGATTGTGIPKWVLNWSNTYNIGKWSTNLTARYINRDLSMM